MQNLLAVAVATVHRASCVVFFPIGDASLLVARWQLVLESATQRRTLARQLVALSERNRPRWPNASAQLMKSPSLAP